MDEIIYCLIDIKNSLINENKFNADKLELKEYFESDFDDDGRKKIESVDDILKENK